MFSCVNWKNPASLFFETGAKLIRHFKYEKLVKLHGQEFFCLEKFDGMRSLRFQRILFVPRVLFCLIITPLTLIGLLYKIVTTTQNLKKITIIQAENKAPNQLPSNKIISYNTCLLPQSLTLLKGELPNNLKRADTIGKSIKNKSPALIAFQEVFDSDAITVLHKHLGQDYHFVFTPGTSFIKGVFLSSGLLTLVHRSITITKTCFTSFAQGAKEDRLANKGFLEVHLALKNSTTVFINTHTNSGNLANPPTSESYKGGYCRQTQIQTLTSRVESLRQQNPENKIITAGDFNCNPIDEYTGEIDTIDWKKQLECFKTIHGTNASSYLNTITDTEWKSYLGSALHDPKMTRDLTEMKSSIKVIGEKPTTSIKMNRIDHIFGIEQIPTVFRLTTESDPFINEPSDHLAIETTF